MENINVGRLCYEKRIKPSLEEDPKLGVCVLFRNDKYKMWFDSQCPLTDFTKHRIGKALADDYYSDFESDFVIIDKHGKVLYSNCDAEITIDENHYIYINDTSYLVTVIEDKEKPMFVGGKNKREIDKKVAGLVSQKIIKKPKDFDGQRLTRFPIYKQDQEPASLG